LPLYYHLVILNAIIAAVRFHIFSLAERRLESEAKLSKIVCGTVENQHPQWDINGFSFVAEVVNLTSLYYTSYCIPS